MSSIFEFEDVVVSLFEGHYHHGVAALANSLVRSGFQGLICIGYKGDLPTWVTQLKRIDKNTFLLKSDISIRFQAIETDLHFGFYKPFFLVDILDTYPICKRIYYFDPDIVINAPWKFFKDWVRNGAALCLDNCHPFVHHNHPWRMHWEQISPNNWTRNKIDYYVNSGFIGLERKDKEILTRWIIITNEYKKSGEDLRSFNKEGYRHIKTDQDLLNAVLTMSADINPSIIGSEGMGFALPAYLMLHSIYGVKPWKINFIQQLIMKGRRPNVSEKGFFQYCTNPINIFSKPVLLKKRINLKFSIILGRLIGN